MKKSDMKKQRTLNTLKNELTKKERVLGHKDKEIGRIQSKVSFPVLDGAAAILLAVLLLTYPLLYWTGRLLLWL